MSEIPGWPGYDTNNYEMRLGEPVPLDDSQRHWRDGYIDLTWLQRTAEGMSWRNHNPHHVASFALQACLSDVVDFKYRRELEAYYASRKPEEATQEPVILASDAYHQFPLDIRHVSEVKDDDMGVVRPVTQIEYFDARGGVTQELLDYTQWMVAVTSLRDYCWRFRKQPAIAGEVNDSPEFMVDHYGTDEEELLHMAYLVNPAASK